MTSRKRADDSPATPQQKSAAIRQTGGKNLSIADETFIQHLLETGSATEAEVRTTGTKMKRSAVKSNAKRRMKKPAVRRRIEELRQGRLKQHEVTAENVIGRLAAIAFTDIRDVVEWGDTLAVKDVETNEVHTVDSVAFRASKKLSPEAAAAIASIEKSKDGAIKIKFHDKRAALVDLGKHLGIFKVDNEQAAKAAAEAAAAAASKDPRDIARAITAIFEDAFRLSKAQAQERGA